MRHYLNSIRISWQEKFLLPKLLPYLFILGIWVVIVITNYQLNTWLTGWDNLHPEFNFLLNIKRSLFPTWQEYQGLGLLGGMGHGAAFIRELLLLPLSLLFPASSLRYLSFFLMLLLGAFGSIRLMSFLSEPTKSSKTVLGNTIAGVFYLLNIGTIQNFYTPFEPFTWFFGFFPWLLFIFLKNLAYPSRKNFILFITIGILASPLAYLQTTFLVYAVLLLVSSATFLFQKIDLKKSSFKANLNTVKPIVKKLLALLGISILINAFWLLPVFYFTLTSAQVTVNSKINQIATTEVALNNRDFGSFANVIRLRGYWLNLQDYNVSSQQPQYLFEVWRNHLQLGEVNVISWMLAVLIFLGLISLFFQRNRYRFIILGIFLLCYLMLAGESNPSGIIIAFLNQHIPLFNQIFRSPFTKWVVPASLIYAILVGFGANFIISRIKSRPVRITVQAILGSLITAAIIYASLPVFQGNFFYKAEKIQLPSSYSHLFKFFDAQPKQTRIAFLPSQTLWGWNFHKWGYRGSGFLWYGVEQPILDRAFDVWSAYDETFYNQFSTAIYRQNPSQLAQVLHRYNVSYLLLDESVTTYNNTESALYTEQTKQILKLLNINEVWKEDFLHVYKVDNIPTSFVFNPSNYTLAEGRALYTKEDPIYDDLGNYVSFPNRESTIYPFSDLSREEIEGITFNSDQIRISRKLDLPDANYNVKTIAYATGSAYTTQINASYTENKIQINFSPSPQISFGEQTLNLPQLPPISVELPSSYDNVVINLGGNILRVPQNTATASAIVTLQIGLPIEISTVDQTAIREQDTKSVVDPKEVIHSVEPKTIWENFLNFHFSFNGQVSSITVTIPVIKESLDFQTSNNMTNCDVFKRGEISKEVKNGQILYEAKNNGAACDGVRLDSVNPRTSYFLRLQGEGMSGRGFKFYLENLNNRHSELEVPLPNGKFDKSYSILGSSSGSNLGYFSSLETRSFGQEASQNALTNAEMYYLPLDELTHLRFIPDPETRITNPVIIKKIWKFGTYQYGVNINSSNHQGLVVLGQGYDSGWIAFSSTNPFHLLPHLQYNGWANAWQVPQGESEIMIIFWPQLLSFVGYAILLITLLGFGTYALRQRQKTVS